MRDTQLRTVEVRPVAAGDRWWLVRAGLAPAMVGTQYHWAEAPLQLLIAPARPTPLRPGPTSIIEVDGRRAGYIGRNPLSGNLEYFLEPWARGGTGSRAIAEFLRTQRRGDRARAFYVSKRNDRSKAALLRAFATLGWSEGTQFQVEERATSWWITVQAEPDVPMEQR